ncbi:unnamed protein product [Boreogadus saida]
MTLFISCEDILMAAMFTEETPRCKERGALLLGGREGGREPSGRDVVGGERTNPYQRQYASPRAEWEKTGAIETRPRSRTRPGD